jgi:formylglycine-generating enzyme required for sulfatase activity/tRNA A-37 threonylcarbamoyl transferase component Bud32
LAFVGEAGMIGKPAGKSSAIDRAADRFERAWKAGASPRIEDYLDGVTGEGRCQLFEELLLIELELRRRLGVLPDVEGYRRRFPDLVAVVDRNVPASAGSCATEQFVGGAPTTFVDPLFGPEADRPPTASTVHDPRFRVLRHHADGGVGRVSVALDLELHRQVALKELKDRFADDPQFRERFLLEVEVTGRLEHPGVIPVYSLGRDERGRPFYAMRFIEGEDLEQAIKRFHAADASPDRQPGERALALRQLLRRFMDVCNVVAYAHSRGILHRDLKPGNILLGPYGETLVVDWGMAKRVDGCGSPAEIDEVPVGPESSTSWNETQQGVILGTIPYMSPEQAEGRSLGTESDVYSLGATLYHILTGRSPITKADKFAMLTQVRQGQISPPREANHRVSAALDAICRKAMSQNPDDRYASPRALADEIEHWLADEPVAAWNEPYSVRARRWVSRHRTPVAAAAAALAVAAIAVGHLLHDYQVRAAERRAKADGLVVALKAAEVREVDGIIGQLESLRPLVRDRLRAMAQPGLPEAAGARRNAALALLPDEPEQAGYLVDHILRDDVHPREISVIRHALLSNGLSSGLEPRLWRLIEEGRESSSLNLGAAGALAFFTPQDPRWAQIGTPIAAELVSKSPLLIGGWRDVFQPIQRSLVGPLRAIFGDADRPRERAIAGSLLLDFAVQPDNPRRDEDLAELIGDAAPDDFSAIHLARPDPRKAVPVLLAKLKSQDPPSEASSRRRGRIAAALILLGSADHAWPLLSSGTDRDPGARAELIHDIAAYGVAARALVDRFAVESDARARRALVLALGEYMPGSVPEDFRRKVAYRLLKLYASDPDPGLHSAIDWLWRRKWKLGPELDSLDQSWRGRGISADRSWFVNSEGVTMALMPVASPLEFEMGSPGNEEGRDSDERIHTVLLDRSFAIATREVTVAQFERFLTADAKNRRTGAGGALASCGDCPILGVDWLAAAGYCNWLSRSEHFEPYYLIRETALSIPHPDGLGYRLPSELEWGYACRAGSRASRPFGSSEALLEKYAWFLLHGGKASHAVGLLKPNDLGLFDMLGNAFEWTEDRYRRDTAMTNSNSAGSAAKAEKPLHEVEVVLRGGSFSSAATALRSAYRERSSPSDPLATYGFRYVRTVRLPGKNGTSGR